MDENCACARAGRPLACGRCSLPAWLRDLTRPDHAYTVPLPETDNPEEGTTAA